MPLLVWCGRDTCTVEWHVCERVIEYYVMSSCACMYTRVAHLTGRLGKTDTSKHYDSNPTNCLQSCCVKRVCLFTVYWQNDDAVNSCCIHCSTVCIVKYEDENECAYSVFIGRRCSSVGDKEPSCRLQHPFLWLSWKLVSGSRNNGPVCCHCFDVCSNSSAIQS